MKIKNFCAFVALMLMSSLSLSAQKHTKNEAVCADPDYILGEYLVVDEDGTSKAKIYQMPDGTYRCQTMGDKPSYDKDGNIMLDKYNPVPELRSLPLHQAVIISGLRYNKEKKQWDGGKIHHPLRKLLKADATVDFVDDGKTIRVRGTVAGMGASRYWEKL